MGKVELIEHDGNGGISFDERPFVVMADRAAVDLGTVDVKAATGKEKKPGNPGPISSTGPLK